MKLIAFLLYVSFIVMAQAGRASRNRKLGIRSGTMNLSKISGKKADGSADGFTIREAKMGTIEKWHDLPDVLDYDHTSVTQDERDRNELKHYNKRFLLEYDDSIPNMLELSLEIYDLYFVDPYNGKYRFRNDSWAILFMPKNDDYGMVQALLLHENYEALKARNIRIALVDIFLDDLLSATYDRKFTTQMFFLDNNTDMAYSWEYDLMPNETMRWIDDKLYLNSMKKFKIPRSMYWNEYEMYNTWRQFRLGIGRLIGEIMDQGFSKLPLNNIPPISLMYNYDGNDVFDDKFIVKMKFLAVSLILLIIGFIQCLRNLCCKTVRYVKPKRLIDKDD